MKARFVTSPLLLVFLSACSTSTPPPAVVVKQGPVAPEIQTFSDTQPYTSLVVLGDFLYAGTPSGLIRFDLKSRQHVRLTREQGLPGNQVLALSGHLSAGLWVATDGGISRFQDGAWTNIPATPVALSIRALLATADGVWAGGAHGLFRLRGGTWTRFLPGAHVVVMRSAVADDSVWIGTDGEGIYQARGERLLSHSQATGQPLRTIKSIAFNKEGGLIAVGRDDQQREGLAFYDGRHWTALSVDPPGRLFWADRVGNDVLLAYEDKILALDRLGPNAEAPKPAPGRVTLSSTRSPLAPSSVPVPRFTTRLVERWFPKEPTVVLGYGPTVFMGTRSAGVAAFDGQRVTWYRTRDLIGQSDHLRVGCLSNRGCYLASVGRSLRLGPEGFAPVSVDSDSGLQVQQITETPGALLALSVGPDGQTLVVSKLADKDWTRLLEKKMAVPDGRLEVRFARVAPGGAIWAGLSYVDREGSTQPWGVAVLNEGAEVVYHRSSLLPTEDRAPGSLALPDDIRDVFFAGEDTWFSTSTGICRVRGSKVDVFTENEGLESEIVYTLTRGPGGKLYAATHGGVGAFDGKWWRFDLGSALASASRALLARGDQLWVATDAGVVGWSRSSTRTITTRQGLGGDRVFDLYLEADRRLWVLTDGGLSIVTL